MDVIYKIRNKETRKFYSKSLSESGYQGSTKGGDVYTSPVHANKRVKKILRFNNSVEWEVVKFMLTEITEE